MEIEGKTKVIKRIYDTSDIVRVVIECFNKYYKTCADVAQTLAAYDAAGRIDERQTCENIWQYVLDHTRYEEDGAFKQLVRSPARLMHDGVGDCKSMAIFCASCLTCLGVPCKFRFVSFTEGVEKASHVYVVTESGINVDPVEAFQNGRPFNEVTPFSWHMDKVIDKGLAILSGLGATTAPFEVWTGDRAFYENTMAANYIYSEIDLALTDIRIDGDDVDALNRCTFWAVALTLYRKHSLDSDTLQRCGYVLQQMTNEGQFVSADTSDEGRAELLEALTSQAEQNLADGVEALAGDVVNVWDAQIMAKNYGATREVRNAFANDQISGTTKNELLAKIKESAPYFFYLFLTDADLAKYRKKVPVIVQRKQKETNVFNNWVKTLTLSATLDKNTVYNYLKSGVKERFTMTPSTFLAKYVSGTLTAAEKEKINKAAGGKINGIGVLTLAVATVISAACALASAIVGAILSYLQSKLDKQVAATQRETEQIRQETEQMVQEYGGGTLEESDLTTLSGETTSSSGSGSIGDNKGLLIAAAAAAFILLK